MSIINQALKKAQRERLLHETQGLPPIARPRILRATKRWPLFVGGLVGVLSIGVALHSWLTSPRPSTVIDTAPPVTTTYAASERPANPSMSSVITPPPDAAERTISAPASHSALPEHAKLATTLPALQPQPEPAQDQPSAMAQSTATTPAAVPVIPTEQARAQARTLFNQAIEAHTSGRQTHALTLLQQSITLDPDLKAAYNSLGNVYYELQQYHQALHMYQRALDIDPGYAKARNNLGSTYLRLAMDDRAREELHKALQADSTYGLAYYNLACVYARAGDSAMAAQYLQQAITLEPQARTWARVDDDFTRVRTAPEIQPLLGPS